MRSEATGWRERRRAEAKAEHQRLLAEGERTLSAARAAAARRRAELIGSHGGRLWLAREAARKLRLERVVVDSRDPRVPNVLELEALVRALAGSP